MLRGQAGGVAPSEPAGKPGVPVGHSLGHSHQGSPCDPSPCAVEAPQGTLGAHPSVPVHVGHVPVPVGYVHPKAARCGAALGAPSQGGGVGPSCVLARCTAVAAPRHTAHVRYFVGVLRSCPAEGERGALGVGTSRDLWCFVVTAGARCSADCVLPCGLLALAAVLPAGPGRCFCCCHSQGNQSFVTGTDPVRSFC